MGGADGGWSRLNKRYRRSDKEPRAETTHRGCQGKEEGEGLLDGWVLVDKRSMLDWHHNTVDGNREEREKNNTHSRIAAATEEVNLGLIMGMSTMQMIDATDIISRFSGCSPASNIG